MTSKSSWNNFSKDLKPNYAIFKLKMLSFPNNRVGSCRILFGSMVSSKSTHLRKEITELADIGLKVLYINYTDDIRVTESGDGYITTHHSGYKGLSDKVATIPALLLTDVDVTEYDAIAIDEGQFFKDLDVVVRKWVLQQSKIVIIASLDGNFMMEPFGKAHNLICLCEPGNVVKLPAICVKCLEKSVQEGHITRVPAGYTAKINVGGPEIEIGGTDKYMPVCMACHNKHMSNYKEVDEIVVSLDNLALDVKGENATI